MVGPALEAVHEGAALEAVLRALDAEVPELERARGAGQAAVALVYGCLVADASGLL